MTPEDIITIVEIVCASLVIIVFFIRMTPSMERLVKMIAEKYTKGK